MWRCRYPVNARSPTRIWPSVRMSALSPPRWIRSLMIPGRVSRCRCWHGSQSSTPMHSTSPTRNRLPTRSLSRTPRTTTWRRACAPVSPTSSSASASISVSAWPGFAPSAAKCRSPRSPLPATAATAATGLTASPGPILISSTVTRPSWRQVPHRPTRLPADASDPCPTIGRPSNRPLMLDIRGDREAPRPRTPRLDHPHDQALCGPKGAGDHPIQLGSHHADLRLRQLRHPEGLSQLLHPPRRDAQQVRRRHHGRQRPLRPAPALQQPLRVVAALPQLRHRQLDRPRTGVPLTPPVPVPGVHPLRGHLPVPGPAHLLDLGVHHPLRKALDHLPQKIRARRRESLLELHARNRHNVTCGHFALLRLSDNNSKDHEVAVSRQADTPVQNETVTTKQGPHTPLAWT